MRRLVLSGFLCVQLVAAPTDDDFALRVAKMHTHFAKFFRAYFGCPDDARSTDDCRPALGHLDAKAFRESRVAAVKLFGEMGR
jgi:hypothetical protein